MIEMGDAGGTASREGREQALADTFVMLADTLVDDYDIADLLQHLIEACAHLLKASAAGLLLIDQRGGLAVVASSSEQSRLLEIFQLQADQGPCLDCVRTGVPVVSGDLGQDTARWPAFVAEAAEAGFRSVVAVPMRLRADTIGGLNLFYRERQELPPTDQRLAQALADVATIGILQQRLTHRSTVLAEQLQTALHSRITIEQAKGIIAERHELDMDESFALMRRHARDHNRKLTDVALSVIGGDIDPARS